MDLTSEKRAPLAGHSFATNAVSPFFLNRISPSYPIVETRLPLFGARWPVPSPKAADDLGAPPPVRASKSNIDMCHSRDRQVFFLTIPCS